MHWKSKITQNVLHLLRINLDVSLKLDTNGKITTQLYDKRDDFSFSIVNFPYLCSNIPASLACGVCKVNTIPILMHQMRISTI